MRHRNGSRLVVVSFAILAVIPSGCSHSGVEYHVVFADAPQLPVGRVEAVSFRNSGQEAPSEVVATILLKPGNYEVREGGRFQVWTGGLGGEDYINIVPSPSKAPRLSSGATLQGETPPNLSSLAGVSSFVDLGGLAKQLNNMPVEKRQEVLKKLHHFVDEAAAADSAPDAGRASGRKD